MAVPVRPVDGDDLADDQCGDRQGRGGWHRRFRGMFIASLLVLFGLQMLLGISVPDGEVMS